MESNKQKVVTFLNSIGIRTVPGKIPVTSFLPTIRIRRGTLFYGQKALAADLLHEAGHIAIVPKKYRLLCNGDMEKSVSRIWEIACKAGETHDPDAPIARAIMQASECEAIAWSWAAGQHLGLREEAIITNYKHHFNGEGREIRTCLKMRCHFGINGLRAAGMIESVKTFPQMTHWVQP
jgi:hypothetical protein